MSEDKNIMWDSEITWDEPPTEQPATNRIKNPLISPIEGLGLGALGAIKGSQWYRQPWNTRNALIKQSTQLQQQLGVQGGRITDIPQAISAKVNTLKQSLKNVDNTILKTPINNLTQTLQKGYAPFYKSAYENYGQGLSILDNKMSEVGASLKTSGLFQEVIKPILDKYEGLLKDVKIPDLPDEDITIGKAKQLYQSIEKQLPTDAQFKIRSNWGKFLESSAPKGIAESYKELNRNYQEIAQTRNEILKHYNPQTGEFNKEGLARYFQKYAKSKFETGVKELISVYSKGNKLTKPIEGIGQAFANLENIKTNQIGSLVKEIDQWGTKLNETKSLLSKIKVAQKRVDIRSVAGRAEKVPLIGQAIRIVFPKGLPNLALNVLPLLQAGMASREAKQKYPNDTIAQVGVMAGVDPEEQFRLWQEANQL